ncbi:M48 family metalloprotease [Streptomyces tropicalis]|uniref:M48 family metalloprotease n=1 Tax=Streptomyces tropicalis TaxID=3034234 RepID=A0ABT6AAE9_9ACTN|nr:M48 family metallopeptidase [Streptomyces tropicalis]MDF3301633.1 M48 family metalloprotease [Streptomyces tropicalis]
MGLLVGHYPLALVVLAMLVVGDWILVCEGQVFTFNGLEGLLGSVAIAWALVRGVFLVRRADKCEEQPYGLSVTPRAQPGLWERVRQVAEAVGTRPPTELVLTAEAAAGVRQDRRWGVIPGERRLYLGVPLLLGLSRDQLDAVLAHELGHYANGDVRWAATVWTTRHRLLRTVLALRERAEPAADEKGARQSPPGPDHHLAKLFTVYARFCLRATQSVSRRQEFAADLVAARVAGRDNAVAALRRIPVLEAAHDVYWTDYALMGSAVGLFPPAGLLHGGFSLFLADGTRACELAEAERFPPPDAASAYDSHPPAADRIAALEALADDGRRPDAEPLPAAALLCAPDHLCAELEMQSRPGPGAQSRRVAWPDLPKHLRLAEHMRAAQPLRDALAAGAAPSGADPAARAGVEALLDLVDRGTWFEVAARLPRSDVAARSTGRASREFARTAFRHALHHLSLLALVEAGHLTWELSWAGPPVRTIAPDGLFGAVESALNAVVADPCDTEPLRTLIAAGPGAEALHSSRPFAP